MDHVKELAMDIADDDNGLFHSQQVRFIFKNIHDFVADTSQALLFNLAFYH